MRKYTYRTKGLITACDHVEDGLQSPITQNSTIVERNSAQTSLNSLEKATDNANYSSFCSCNVENNTNTPITLGKSGPSNFPGNNNKAAFTSKLPTKPRILEESNITNLPTRYIQNLKSVTTESDKFEDNSLIKTPTLFFRSNNESKFKFIPKSTDESPVFTMANGRKAPSYSMNALTKAGIIMNNDVQNTTAMLSYNVDNSFQNDSGLVAVSNDSLIKTRQLKDHNVFATLSHNSNVSKSSGFSTASGRNLTAVTEDSLIRARQTLNDNTSQILTYEIVNSESSIANNRNLSHISHDSLNKPRGQNIAAISDESLKRVRGILNDDTSQNFTLQDKLQNNIAGTSDSKLAADNSNSKFRVEESFWIHSRSCLKNKNAKIFSRNIVAHSHALLPRKRRKSLLQVSQNSSCPNSPSPSKMSKYNSTNKLFDLASSTRRVGLKDIVSNYPLNFSPSHLQELGISKDIINMSPKSAISYRFTCSEGSSRENEQWVCNHYRWIVWKIACMIRSFPYEFHGWWNPRKVLDQLQYRYEREINNSHRSALKLIIEGDGTASMPMVLCVSDIIKEEVTHEEIGIKENACKTIYSLELTDMWYKILADVDQPLQRAISKSKIRIGYKLEICGAKIVGGSVKVPALEVPNSTRLKLSANSTKRAHWDAKLGFKRFRPYAMLRSLCPDGGYIFAVDIIVLRKYPMIFRETMKDGTVINRNEQEEEYAKSEHENWLNNKIQSLINEYKTQHKQKNKSNSKSIIRKQAILEMTSGEQLYVMMQDCLEPSKFWQNLSLEQIQSLQNYIQKKEQEKVDRMNKWVYDRLEELNYTRKILPFFKIRVCDYHLNTPREAIINVWQPNELLFNTIKEGRRYKVYNITARNYSTSSASIYLSSMGHSTIWKEAKIDDTSNASSFYLSRSVTCLDELQKMELNNEVDLVIYILVVGEPFMSGQRFGKPIKVQTLLVIDNSGQLAQIEIKNTSSRDLFKPKNILIFLNLQYRAYDSKYGIYMLSTNDDTEIKRSTREEYIIQAKENLESWIKNNYDLVKKCEATAKKLCEPEFNISNNFS
ncbi:breast cancer type 2 susceptibility protein [Rhizophagus clarus]|uniref:Breast cancer type 2 susceptibility protein n=1 Tax=Rhizophagus clarus TaxID=94130 RepID=A0A8H3QI84_9GLOM|nr:breast cancer type 2 susceptibility protein [Rhizophagus clarus]